MVESCEDAAAGASLDDLREIASVIALWPPVCLPWVLPRLGHRLLFACFFDSDLRSLVSAELLEAAIRRDEQRFRDASDARLSGSTTKYAIARRSTGPNGIGKPAAEASHTQAAAPTLSTPLHAHPFHAAPLDTPPSPPFPPLQVSETNRGVVVMSLSSPFETHNTP